MLLRWRERSLGLFNARLRDGGFSRGFVDLQLSFARASGSLGFAVEFMLTIISYSYLCCRSTHYHVVHPERLLLNVALV